MFKRILLFFTFSLGIFASLLLMGMLTWASIESEYYGFLRLADGHLDGLHCPALMTRTETSTIFVNVYNSAPKTIRLTLEINLSTPAVAQKQITSLTLNPGQTGQVTWQVSPENIDLGQFIFAKVYRYSSYPLPMAEAACGIFILDLPLLSGAQYFWILLCLALIGTLLGLWQLEIFFAQIQKSSGLVRSLALVTLLGLLLNLFNNWLLGLLGFTLTIIMLLVAFSTQAAQK